MLIDCLAGAELEQPSVAGRRACGAGRRSCLVLAALLALQARAAVPSGYAPGNAPAGPATTIGQSPDQSASIPLRATLPAGRLTEAPPTEVPLPRSAALLGGGLGALLLMVRRRLAR
jgi:hypothetical protein